jgi:Pyruvate/2-oxoacid:ferredoxin oxidoreductase delta subunit
VDALGIAGFDFLKVVAGLRKAESPVLGCIHKEGLRSHAKTPCLGFLSAEHLVSILSFADGMVQLNLSGCRECENGFVTNNLGRVFEAVHKMLPGAALRLRPVHAKEELEFRDIPMSRRGFFMLLRESALEGVSGAAEELNRTDKPHPYGSKRIPMKRELINRARQRSAAVNSGFLDFYFTAKVDDTCNACAACAAVCPNGALKRGREGKIKALLFNASRCRGCGLCEEFCMHKSIKLVKGHGGAGLSEYVSVKIIFSVEVEQGNAA